MELLTISSSPSPVRFKKIPAQVLLTFLILLMNDRSCVALECYECEETLGESSQFENCITGKVPTKNGQVSTIPCNDPGKLCATYTEYQKDNGQVFFKQQGCVEIQASDCLDQILGKNRGCLKTTRTKYKEATEKCNGVGRSGSGPAEGGVSWNKGTGVENEGASSHSRTGGEESDDNTIMDMCTCDRNHCNDECKCDYGENGPAGPSSTASSRPSGNGPAGPDGNENYDSAANTLVRDRLMMITTGLVMMISFMAIG